MTFSGDADYVRTRWLADPKTALGLKSTENSWAQTSLLDGVAWAFSDPCQWSLSGGIVESAYF